MQTTVTVTGVTAHPSAFGPLSTGATVAFTLALSRSVTVSGSPVLALSNGATATYSPSESTANSLVFRYAVAAGQDTGDLKVTGVALNGAAITSAGAFGLTTATSYAAGSTPFSLTIADVTGDGKPDVIVADSGGGLSLLAGNGTGVLGIRTALATGGSVRSVKALDVNGDGKTDLIASNSGGTVGVLLGNGSGGFSAATTYAAGTAPYGLATADLNGDGRPDLVVANENTGVSVLLNNGSGGFGAPASYSAGSNPVSVALADLNGDGRADLAVADIYGRVSVRLGDGAGGFGAATLYAAGAGPNSVTVADVNQDGLPDLVVSDYNGGASVLLNSGGGTFGAATTYSVGVNPYGATVADVDGDGVPDILVADLRGGLCVLLGNGSGGFGTARTFAVAGQFPTGVASADLNGDGLSDVVVAAGGSNTVSVYVNTSALPAALDPASAGTATGADTGLAIDTTAPTVTAALALDTGTPGDTVTSSPTLTGTAEANGAVEILNGATTLGSTTADAQGMWTFRPTLGDGSYALIAAETDPAGNIGSAAMSFTLDTTAPSVAAVSYGGPGIDGSGNGSIGAGALVTFTVTTDEPVYVAGTPIVALNDGGTATYAGGSGTNQLIFTYRVAAGENTAALQVADVTGADGMTDAAGNPLALSSLGRASLPSGKLTIDTTVPTPSAPGFVVLDGGVVYDAATGFTVTGSVDSPAGVAGVEISAIVDGARQDLGPATIAPDGKGFTFTDAVTPGVIQYDLEATLTDRTGQTTASTMAHFDLLDGIEGEPYVARQDNYDVSTGAFVGQTFFNGDGTVTYGDVYTDNGNGTATYDYFGGTFFDGKRYAGFSQVQGLDGTPLEETRTNNDGTHTTTLYAGGQSVEAQGFDLIRANGTGDNTFVFLPGFGNAAVRGFTVAGQAHDTLDLAGTGFNSVAQVLRNTQQIGGGAVITDPTTGEAITLQGVTKTELRQNRGDFSLAG